MKTIQELLQELEVKIVIKYKKIFALHNRNSGAM